MKKTAVVLSLSTIIACGAVVAQADPVSVSYTTPSSVWGILDATQFDPNRTSSSSPDWYDYGDAVGYGEAKHRKGQWQGLGQVNGEDDGVVWSVGGSAFGTDADLVIGEDVTFKFLFWQANNGNHTYDQIFAAFDFGQDGVFDDPEDTLFYEQIFTNMEYRDDTTRDNSRYIEFEMTFTVPDTMTVGSTWLRSRVHCNHTHYGDITAYNYLKQGEVEDYQLNLVASEVPEPATMLLFGTGLVGLATMRRRKKK